MNSDPDPNPPAPAVDLRSAAAVTVVTVTYGERRDLLRQVLDALPRQGVGKVVVVNNGARWPVKAELTEAYGERVDVVEMGHNTGSAPGFAAGIQRAVELGAEYLWLLDDDNRPESGCLDILLRAHAGLREQCPADRLAVLAFRCGHQPHIALNPRHDSFSGFHVLDVPYKIWRRTPWGRAGVRGSLPAQVELNMATYGGLLFHRAMVQRFGLPRADFVLYADDLEFSYRIKKAGGRIVLVTAAELRLMESPWGLAVTPTNSFSTLLHLLRDFRAYYSIRNLAYFETHYLPYKPWVYALNRGIYLAILTIQARLQGERPRLALVRQAIADGVAGRLGVHPDYPL